MAANAASGGVPRRRARLVEGNDLLYHYLQKTLLEEDADQYRLLTSRLVVALGVWLPPVIYQRFPVMVPFAARDASCRGSRAKGLPDQWGAPDAFGQFRDDNSLIKSLPRSLPVTNPGNRLLHGKKLGTSFVAAHVWRKLNDGSDAPKNRLTYSFAPNLVWLPTQLAKLSDREDSHVQTFLQAISRKIYKPLELAPTLHDVVDPIWDLLPERTDATIGELPDTSNLNFFQANEQWFARRAQTLATVLAALKQISANGTASGKVVASRYGEGLARLQPTDVRSLHSELTRYLAATA